MILKKVHIKSDNEFVFVLRKPVLNLIPHVMTLIMIIITVIAAMRIIIIATMQ